AVKAAMPAVNAPQPIATQETARPAKNPRRSAWAVARAAAFEGLGGTALAALTGAVAALAAAAAIDGVAPAASAAFAAAVALAAFSFSAPARRSASAKSLGSVIFSRGGSVRVA